MANFSCFGYHGATAEDILKKLKLEPKTIKQSPTARQESIIGAENTDCFRVDKLIVDGECEFRCEAQRHLGVVTAGKGTVTVANKFPLKRGDNFFISSRIKKVIYHSDAGAGPLHLYLMSSGGK